LNRNTGSGQGFLSKNLLRSVLTEDGNCKNWLKIVAGGFVKLPGSATKKAAKIPIFFAELGPLV
jgi:hypothetical protein